jgi:hypothetical protein
MSIQIGKVYDVDHQRKGKFVIVVTKTDPQWVTGRIVAGLTDAMLVENRRNVGAVVTMRRSLCTLTEKPPP